MVYTFVDGAGNKYRLDNGLLTYSPMTPEMSSSGSYSGGEPFSAELEKMDLVKIVGSFELAFWSDKDQTDQRTMGSGTLFKKVGDNSKRVYLKMRSESMKGINDLLNDIKERN